jgi:hypothetical protein
MKTRILLVTILLCALFVSYQAWSKPKYVVALEFRETGNLMKMSDDSFSTYNECILSADYRLWTMVGKESGSTFLCTKSKTKY